MVRIMICSIVLSLIAFTVSHAEMSITVPEGTQYYLYIRDIKNLEDNLRKSGILNLSQEYIDYLVDYLKDDHPSLGVYQELKNMDDGNFVKAVLGEVAVLNISGGNLVLCRLEKSSAYFTTIMGLFRIKGKFKDYYVDFYQDNILLSKSQGLIENYKQARKLKDPVLDGVNVKDADILYYKNGEVVFNPFIDSFFGNRYEQKSVLLSVNFQKKSIEMALSPRMEDYAGGRQKDFGSRLPSTVIGFMDVRQNPYDVFLRIFGEGPMKKYEKDFKDNFENQLAFALAGLSSDITPSFVAILKPAGGREAASERTLTGFFETVIGEKNWDKKTFGNFSANYGRTCGIYYYNIAGFTILSDSEAIVTNSIGILTGRVPSVWDDKNNAKLKDLVMKKSAVYFNLSAFANSVYLSAQKKMKLTARDKDDLKAYLKAVKEMGTLVGFSENRPDHSYFYLQLKKEEK